MFYYICGEVVLESQRKPLSQLVRKAYELYFGCREKLMNCIFAVRSEIEIKFGRRRFAATHFKDFGRLVESYPQINAFCCSDGVA
jgi:hypothetical protein